MNAALRQRIRDLYAAYEKGDLDFVLAGFDDDAIYISLAPTDVFPYLGRKVGKAAIAAALKAIDAQFELLSYQPTFIVAEADDAAVIVLARFRQRATGRVIHLFLAHFLRFRDGRIVELREFMDSFDAVQQVLGREIDVGKL